MLYSADEIAEWAAFLERRFIAAAQTEDAYAEGARAAHRHAVEWINSNSTAKGSFLWVCDLLGVEPDAVRRALRDRQAEGAGE